MIHYCVACHKDKSDKFFKPSLDILLEGEREVFYNNTSDSIFKKYNDFLNTRKFNPDDVIVFAHDDITLQDPLMEKKLEMYFKHKKNIGIAGVIGTTMFPAEGGWWMVDRRQFTRGKILQGDPVKESYMMNDRPGFHEDLVSVDGCILFMSGRHASKIRWDEETYDGFHFYDVDTCLRVLEMGLDVGVIDVLVEHQSEGPLTQEWFRTRNIFVDKWTKRGLTFPIIKRTINTIEP